MTGELCPFVNSSIMSGGFLSQPNSESTIRGHDSVARNLGRVAFLSISISVAPATSWRTKIDIHGLTCIVSNIHVVVAVC